MPPPDYRRRRRHIDLWLPWLIIILLGAVVYGLAGGAMPFRESGDRIEGHATITDGDTIKIAGRRIRLHGIEAPESEQRCQDSAGASPAGPGEGRELAALIGVHNLGRAEALDHLDQGLDAEVVLPSVREAPAQDLSAGHCQSNRLRLTASVHSYSRRAKQPARRSFSAFRDATNHFDQDILNLTDHVSLTMPERESLEFEIWL